MLGRDTQTGELETAVIELFNPGYDITTNTVRYDIVAENATSINLPVEFGQSILVIDATDNHNGLMGATYDHNAVGGSNSRFYNTDTK